MAQAIPLIMAVAGAAAQQYNTNKTADRQDASVAEGIRRQSGIQKKADAKVNEQVDKLAASRSDDERATRMSDYMKTLTTARKKTDTGLENAALGEAFNAAGADARASLAAQGAERANLMAGIDAAGLQRQGEATDFGRLATDLSLVGRESEGQRFLTDLRTRSIRRNPWIDAGAAALSGAASGMAGGMGGAGVGLKPLTYTGGNAKTGAVSKDLLAAMRGGYGG